MSLAPGTPAPASRPRERASSPPRSSARRSCSSPSTARSTPPTPWRSASTSRPKWNRPAVSSSISVRSNSLVPKGFRSFTESTSCVPRHAVNWGGARRSRGRSRTSHLRPRRRTSRRGHRGGRDLRRHPAAAQPPTAGVERLTASDETGELGRRLRAGHPATICDGLDRALDEHVDHYVVVAIARQGVQVCRRADQVVSPRRPLSG